MSVIRSLARPLLAAPFILGGIAVLRNPGGRVEAARPVVERVASMMPIAPADPETAVRLNAAVQVGGGAMLAAGILPRLAALALATSLVPTTIAGHAFWTISDPQKRAMQRTQFLKNTAMMGGLLITALD
ncbi:MAG: DoxX family membrane protein [Candidatus Dormibacteraeota bacterium]|nr:DoxX family membrane protein [Candidatus Dormibacteraeota bacterium]